MASEPQAQLHRTQLVEAWLSEVRFKEHSEAGPGDSQADKLGYRVSFTTSVDERHDPPLVGISCEIEWVGSDGEPTPGPFAAVIEVTGSFRVQLAPEDQADLEELLRFNGRYLLWPYVRSYLATVTSLSSHPSLTLFTLQVPAPRVLDPVTEEFGRQS